MFTLFLHYYSVVRYIECIVKYERVHKIKPKMIMRNCKRQQFTI